MAVQHAQSIEQAKVKRRLFTLEEYERMIDAGLFDEDERIELIRGEIVEMAPIGPSHETTVARLTTLMVERTLGKAIIWPQGNSIGLSASSSRPEPDAVLLRWREDYYADKRPTPEDVLLIIEVADSTVKYDHAVKGPLYAQAGIPEYWLVNLQSNFIEVYSSPTAGVYKHVREAKPGEMIALPEQLGEVAISDVLGAKGD